MQGFSGFSLLWLLALGPPAISPPIPRAVTLREDSGAHLISPCTSFLLTPPSDVDPSEVLAQPGWRTADDRHLNFGFVRGAVWLRFSVRNEDPSQRSWTLLAAREWIDEVDLFRVTAQGVERLYTSGAGVAMAARPYPTQRMAFPLQLAPGESAEYLMRLRGVAPLSVIGEIWAAHAFARVDGAEAFVIGAYISILFGLGLYSFMLFLALRERLQLGVSIAVTSYALGEMAAHGLLSPPLIAPGFMEIRGMGLFFGVADAAIITGARYATDLRFRHPKGDKALRNLAGCLAAASSLSVILPRASILIFASLGIMAASVLTTGIVGWLEGARSARYYVVAMGAFVGPGCITLGSLFGWLPAEPQFEFANHIGAVLMSVTISLLVADVIRRDRNRIADLNTELSIKIDDINSANQELRYQVTQRSRALVESLASRIGTLEVHEIELGTIFEERYRVDELLGQGTWGSVYKALRLWDRRAVAIKILNKARTGAQAARMAQEAQIGSQINHANLVAILDVGVWKNSMVFVVMEYVAGETLEQYAKSGLSRDRALRVLRDVARGLELLHEKGITHRDVKPANVLMSGDLRHAKLADFGVAMFRAEGVAQAATTEAAAVIGDDTVGPVSASGLVVRDGRVIDHDVLGTPAYMPPEAFSGREANPSWDVFALGMMACELLLGRKLSAWAQRRDPADLHIERGSTSLEPELEAVLAKAIAANPAARPPVAEFATALEKAIRA